MLEILIYALVNCGFSHFASLEIPPVIQISVGGDLYDSYFFRMKAE